MDITSSRPGTVGTLEASRESFEGDVLLLQTPQSKPSEAFRFVRAMANTSRVAELSGTGRLELAGAVPRR
jgi:hypothetical protein